MTSSQFWWCLDVYRVTFELLCFVCKIFEPPNISGHRIPLDPKTMRNESFTPPQYYGL